MLGNHRHACRAAPAHRTSARVAGTVRHESARAAPRPRGAQRAPSCSCSNARSTTASNGSQLMQRRFDRALLIGCPDPAGASGSATSPGRSTCAIPAPLFAQAAGGAIVEDDSAPPTGATICASRSGRSIPSTILPLALPPLRCALGADAPVHRRACRRRHPARACARRCARRIGRGRGGRRMSIRGSRQRRLRRCSPPPALSIRSSTSIASRPPIPSLGDLVRDLRGDGRDQRAHAAPAPAADPGARRSRGVPAFTSAGNDGRTVETFEILHFAAWTPPRIEG